METNKIDFLMKHKILVYKIVKEILAEEKVEQLKWDCKIFTGIQDERMLLIEFSYLKPHSENERTQHKVLFNNSECVGISGVRNGDEFQILKETFTEIYQNIGNSKNSQKENNI